jgi:hypothetical protein
MIMEDQNKHSPLDRALKVYEGLTAEEINDIERIALDRSNFIRSDYQLLDFGRGRRLEKFGDFLIDRPCPAVERVAKAEPKIWDNAQACFEDGGEKAGRWFFPRKSLPELWTIEFGGIRFELKYTPQGQVGVFPEQAENWEWIRERGEGRGERGEKNLLVPMFRRGNAIPRRSSVATADSRSSKLLTRRHGDHGGRKEVEGSMKDEWHKPSPMTG